MRKARWSPYFTHPIKTTKFLLRHSTQAALYIRFTLGNVLGHRDTARAYSHHYVCIKS